MDTHSFTAMGTCPFSLFTGQKIPDPGMLYTAEIINHAHIVLCPVSLIQVFKSGTWEVIAFKTIPGSSVLKTSAVFNSASPARDRFDNIINPAPRASVPQAQVCQADAAIHSAWSYNQ